MTYFSDLNDDQIVEGLRRHDETITRDYFYGFCRIAYFHLNKYYHLIGQEGLDFYSLAHEYYLSLVMKDWLPLTHRKKETKLSTWMVNGFRYIVLDKIKALQSKMMYESLEERLMQRMSDNNIEIEENPMNYGSTLDELCTELDIRAIDRQILIALLQDGYKSKEVAGWLGITPSAVSQRYHRMLNEKIIPYFKVGYPHIARKYMEEARPRICSIPCESAFEYNEAPTRMAIPLESFAERMERDSVSGLSFTQTPRRNIFVFESNLLGIPASRSAEEAIRYYGAERGQSNGMRGNSYAIPTMQGDVKTIEPYVNEFTSFARGNNNMLFNVSDIGADSGFDAYEIAPLFREASLLDNVILPSEMTNIL
ncbi:MAG: transcriptional regulator [Bacteroidales bacterium]|nr:transcriptional regulator [Bacteroidales bacterium]MCR5192050.1 transcriptional regulator [Bacteroidales bacterium]